MIAEGFSRREPEAGGKLDIAVCIWISLSEDREAALIVLAEGIAYDGPAISPLLMERLGAHAENFASIETAVKVERAVLDKACSLVDERMLRIWSHGWLPRT